MGMISKVRDTVIPIFRESLLENLLGIYLHGSLAMGCFHPAKSDIDLLIVVNEKLTAETKRKIIDQVLALGNCLPGCGLEFSVIRADVLKQHFRYPTPFELHYSSEYKERYKSDPFYLCEDGVDEDIAAHVMVTYERGICLYGKPIREVIPKVEHQIYLQSISNDIQSAEQAIIDRPIYYVLNLLRVLYYLREGVISSKAEAGNWGLQHISERYHSLIQHHLEAYLVLSSTINKLPEQELTSFAQVMLEEIKERIEKATKG